MLYTDGVTDAENGQGHFFGTERLQETVQAHRRRSTAVWSTASEMQESLLAEIHRFVGDAPQFDDITLMVVGKRV